MKIEFNFESNFARADWAIVSPFFLIDRTNFMLESKYSFGFAFLFWLITIEFIFDKSKRIPPSKDGY